MHVVCVLENVALYQCRTECVLNCKFPQSSSGWLSKGCYITQRRFNVRCDTLWQEATKQHQVNWPSTCQRGPANVSSSTDGLWWDLLVNTWPDPAYFWPAQTTWQRHTTPTHTHTCICSKKLNKLKKTNKKNHHWWRASCNFTFL